MYRAFLGKSYPMFVSRNVNPSDRHPTPANPREGASKQLRKGGVGLQASGYAEALPSPQFPVHPARTPHVHRVALSFPPGFRLERIDFAALLPDSAARSSRRRASATSFRPPIPFAWQRARLITASWLPIAAPFS